MRTFLFCLLSLATLSAYAQDVTPMNVPEKAAIRLEKMHKHTQAVVVLGKQASSLPAEARPMLNKILLQSTTDFMSITAKQPTREAYLKSLDAGLTSIMPLVPKLEDRQQVAEYYQDLLEIVGVESSEGRLMAFVEGGAAKP